MAPVGRDPSDRMHAMGDPHISILPIVTASFSASYRTNLALHHLFAACRYATQVQALERDNAGEPFGEFWEELLQHSLGVATLTAASLEGYANEMYFETSIFENRISSAAAAELATLVERESVLRKYEVALAVRAGKQLDLGSTRVQNADALIRLRNAVVHFRPEWSGAQKAHNKLSKKLHRKFEPSPFLRNESLFPLAWASASFAAWALRTTVAFLEHFYSEVGLPCPLDQFRTKLSSMSNNVL